MIKYNLPHALNCNTLDALPLPVLPFEQCSNNISVNGVLLNVFENMNQVNLFLANGNLSLSDFSIKMHNQMIFMLYVGETLDVYGVSMD